MRIASAGATKQMRLFQRPALSQGFWGIVGLTTVLLLTGCPPSAQKRVIKTDLLKVSQDVERVDQRFRRMERGIQKWEQRIQGVEKSTRQARADQSVALDDLRIEIKTLKGELGVLEHDLDELTRANQKFKEDIDLRLLELENRPPTGNSAKPANKSRKKRGRPASAGVDAITRYNQILRIFLDKQDHTTAISQFREFIREHPKSSLAANAQYWIGEGYYARGDFPKAITEFQVVVDRYPKSEKRCDAQLKQGLSFLNMKQEKRGNLFLTEVEKSCKGTAAASKAKERRRTLARKSSKQ